MIFISTTYKLQGKALHLYHETLTSKLRQIHGQKTGTSFSGVKSKACEGRGSGREGKKADGQGKEGSLRRWTAGKTVE